MPFIGMTVGLYLPLHGATSRRREHRCDMRELGPSRWPAGRGSVTGAVVIRLHHLERTPPSGRLFSFLNVSELLAILAVIAAGCPGLFDHDVGLSPLPRRSVHDRVLHRANFVARYRTRRSRTPARPRTSTRCTTGIERHPPTVMTVVVAILVVEIRRPTWTYSCVLLLRGSPAGFLPLPPRRCSAAKTI